MHSLNMEAAIPIFRYIHEWRSVDSNIVFHTIPMFHIGSPEYYQEVSKICNELNLLLVEGVPVKLPIGIGSYEYIAKKIGLGTQIKNLKIDEDIPRKNIDIDRVSFLLELKKYSFSILKMVLLFGVFSLFVSVKKWNIFYRRYFEKQFSYNEYQAFSLIDPKKHYEHKHDIEKYEKLILNKRNEHIVKNLESIIGEMKNREYRYDIGILFGDGHIPVVYQLLSKKGFSWKMIRKIYII